MFRKFICMLDATLARSFFPRQPDGTIIGSAFVEMAGDGIDCPVDLCQEEVRFHNLLFTITVFLSAPLSEYLQIGFEGP